MASVIMAVLRAKLELAQNRKNIRNSVSFRVLTWDQMAGLAGGVGSNPGQPPPNHPGSKKNNGNGNGNGNH